MAHVTFAVAVLALLLATHGVAPLARAQGEVCTDELPPSVDYTCAEQAEWGNCGESWMDGYCLASCGTCDPASARTSASATSAEESRTGPWLDETSLPSKMYKAIEYIYVYLTIWNEGPKREGYG